MPYEYRFEATLPVTILCYVFTHFIKSHKYTFNPIYTPKKSKLIDFSLRGIDYSFAIFPHLFAYSISG